MEVNYAKSLISFILLQCLTTSLVQSVGSQGTRQHGQKLNVKQGGLQDFGGEDDLDNQLKREEFVRNKEHIKEHLKSEANFDPDTATPEELDFHFFKIHDTNSDDKLDGLELLSSIAHGLEEQYVKVEETETDDNVKQRRLRSLNNRAWIAVDRILREDDKDKDGYLTYPEYKDSRRVNKVLSGESLY